MATDGGLLAQSIPGITSFQFAPAERVEIVIDFAQFPTTTTALFLENRLQQTEGRKPDGLDGSLPTHPARPPRPFAPTSQADLAAAVRRTFEFDRSDGGWVITQRFFDPDRPLVTVRETSPRSGGS